MQGLNVVFVGLYLAAIEPPGTHIKFIIIVFYFH